MPDPDDLRDLPLREFRPRSRLRVPRNPVPRASAPVVDAHNHLGRWLFEDRSWAAPDVGELLDVMDACNVAAIVNLDGMWGDELAANLDRYDVAYPGRFATFAQWDRELFAREDWAELAASVRDSARHGARGLKVWKHLGLRFRDDRERLISPDDERLDPVWAAAAELDVPVTIHLADPIAFFDPIDERNERLEELLANPDWWFGGAGLPSFDELMTAFESLVARHPATTFIGAHVACAAEDLAWVGRMLDTYPNLHADIAARIAELGRQPRAARALLERHPDRVLFGTDLFPPDREIYAIHFRFLETFDEHFPYDPEDPPPQGRWTISGLGLPSDILAAVYAGNARRLIPGLV